MIMQEIIKIIKTQIITICVGFSIVYLNRPTTYNTHITVLIMELFPYLLKIHCVAKCINGPLHKRGGPQINSE